MTSQEISLLIAEGDPLTPPDWTLEQEHARHERRERVRRHCVAAFSCSPSYQARAKHDPAYWRTFSPGIVNLPGDPT